MIHLFFAGTRLLALICFGMFAFYAWGNSSGHTGAPFVLVAYIFIAIAVADIAIGRSWFALSYIPYLLLAGILYFTEYLLPYEVAASRGLL